MMRRWVAALLAALFTVVSGPASTAMATTYDAVAYKYEAPGDCCRVG